MLEVKDLAKRFGDVTALAGVTFSVNGPGLIALLGPNGAGKTTLLDLLQGLAEPTSGTFRLFGRAPAPYPRRRVGVVMQREAVLERSTAREYAELFAAIYGVKDGGRTILRRAKLEDRAEVAMSRLSGGEAARLFIASAIVHDPELLFLDEPTAPLDPRSKREVGALIAELAKERTVVLATHDLREADVLADELLFLVGGELKAAGPRAELVAQVPEDARHGVGVEDAFFHFCAVKMRDGAVEADA